MYVIVTIYGGGEPLVRVSARNSSTDMSKSQYTKLDTPSRRQEVLQSRMGRPSIRLAG